MRSANVTNLDNNQISWNQIDWKQTYRVVNNLRQRIYRAAANGDLKRVRNLQKLMLCSRSNKRVSIRKITQQNQGRKTPGIDEVVVRTDKEREALYAEIITSKSGKSYPVKRIYIPKQSGQRPLGLPTIIDRCHQAIVKQALEPYWESQFEGTSYGFRPGRSAHDAIEKIFCIANCSNTRTWVLDADIQGAFDHIDHQFLLNQLKGFPGIQWIKSWLKAGVMEEKHLYPTITGTPQGGVISPLLLNIALHGMEEALGVKRTCGYLQRGCNAVVRYADDFVVFHENRQGCESAKQTLEIWLAQRGLKLSEKKTQIRHLTEGFDFLGFNIRHYPVRNRKKPYIMLIKPSKSSIQNFRNRLKQNWHQVTSWKTEDAINLLNPKIRGWSYYFRIGSSKRIYGSLDAWIWKRQCRFAARRHPTKSWTWKRRKYWGKIDGRNDKWVFMDKQADQHLLKLAWIPIQRHILIKGNASPDNPELQEYWKQRAKRKISCLSKTRRILWKQQEGKCLLCGQRLEDEPIHLHHKQPKKRGGNEQIENLCLLHQACHQQVHGKYKSAAASKLLEPYTG